MTLPSAELSKLTKRSIDDLMKDSKVEGVSVYIRESKDFINLVTFQKDMKRPVSQVRLGKAS